MIIYLDTNIIRDCFKRRSLDTIRLMEIIRERKIKCKSSVFSVMELINVEKDHLFFNKSLLKGEEVSSILRKRSERNLKVDELNDLWVEISNLLESYKFIEFINIEGIGWNMAFGICQVGNLDADDSIHLASAIGSNCDILVTSDKFLKKEGTRIISNNNTIAKKNPNFKKISLEILTPVEILKRFNKVKKLKKKKWNVN
mgnify:CR=1 FL=1